MISAMPTLDDHNFLVRSPFCVFLDSIEIYMSLESNYMHEDAIWFSQNFGKIYQLSALITRIKKKKDPRNLGCHTTDRYAIINHFVCSTVTLTLIGIPIYL